MKNLSKSILFPLLLMVAFIAGCSLDAKAQTPGVYQLISTTTSAMKGSTTNQYTVAGVTNNFGNPGTSTNLALSVADYDNVGVTWQFTGVATTTNGVVALKVYKSRDNGVIYEGQPSTALSWTLPTATSGAATYSTNVTVSCTGVTHLAFVIEQGASSLAGFITNMTLAPNLKATRVWSSAPTSPGTSPGTPIALP